MNRTLNPQPSLRSAAIGPIPWGCKPYENTPFGALGASETYENAAFGALRGCKPYGNAACGTHGAVPAIANPMGIQHAAPLGLTFFRQRRIFFKIPWEPLQNAWLR